MLKSCCIIEWTASLVDDDGNAYSVRMRFTRQNNIDGDSSTTASIEKQSLNGVWEALPPGAVSLMTIHALWSELPKEVLSVVRDTIRNHTTATFDTVA